ncbi:hydroxysqualene dehydroxylase HpnE [Noviherbaspirillum agri]
MAVIGGGWAGCAAAVELAQRGDVVTLFEAARTLGGRARRVELAGKLLDNGQHILLGAYSETLRLMQAVGIRPEDALLRLPLQMRYPGTDGMDFVTPRLPAPLHMLVGLMRAKGLSREDKLSLARFSTTARWMDWQLNNDCSVTELLEHFDQTQRLIRLMWRPLCIAALNTPPERASAKVFLNVLRDSLGARRHASDMLLPRVDLSMLFPDHAGHFIQQRGGEVRLGTSVKSIHTASSGWDVLCKSDREDAAERFDAVIVATSPAHAANVLEGLGNAAQIPAFTFEPITTCYLQYDASVRLSNPFFALNDNGNNREWGQFVFDRGWLDKEQAGLLAVVVSAAKELLASSHDELTFAIGAQLARALQRPDLTTPHWTKVITEKRATFSCTPGLLRPANATALPGLALAGDYTECDYPATLESATRSGVLAARCI